ncbi:MAG: hypothetical protein U0Q15_13065 [Kineosporiaceae bacterium]
MQAVGGRGPAHGQVLGLLGGAQLAHLAQDGPRAPARGLAMVATAASPARTDSGLAL